MLKSSIRDIEGLYKLLMKKEKKGNIYILLCESLDLHTNVQYDGC